MTNTQILNAIAQASNDARFSKRTKDTFLGILTDAQNYVVDKTECLRKIDSSSVVLVADTGEYSLPSSYVKFPSDDASVKRGFIAIGTNARYTLTSTTTALLNSRYPYWRGASSGTPEFAYLIKEGTPKIGFYPKPSSTFLSSYGTKVYLDIIYRPSAIVEDANLPFDNSYPLSGLFQMLLKLRALWQIKMEDTQFTEADRILVKAEALTEEAQDFVNSMLVVPGHHGFEENFQ